MGNWTRPKRTSSDNGERYLWHFNCSTVLTHRAYLAAAKRKKDRDPTARITSALSASLARYKRTGRALYITYDTVMSDMPLVELEDEDQFNDPELMLPAGLTREGLWEELQQAINGVSLEKEEERGEEEEEPADLKHHPQGFPVVLPPYIPFQTQIDPGNSQLYINPLFQSSPTISFNGQTSASQTLARPVIGNGPVADTVPVTRNPHGPSGPHPPNGEQGTEPFDMSEFVNLDSDEDGELNGDDEVQKDGTKDEFMFIVSADRDILSS